MIPELLSPAGNSECLHAAVTAGADAVYLGLEQFNARRNAGNFTPESFAEACDYAHLRGTRVYVTMNTIILGKEYNDALECARQAWRSGADAFIVQDIGLALGLAQALPEARVHASTQMNIHSADGLQAAAELGVKRVTLARELSMEEIAELAAVGRELDVEVEAFVHGALCVCYSGQCFMSSMIGGRSANRGLCAQACRLPYKLINWNGMSSVGDNVSFEDALDVFAYTNTECPGDFLLSPKDLLGANQVMELAKAGVASLKIEGRMKSPEYVASATSVYRAILDRVAVVQNTESLVEDDTQLQEAELSKLEQTFSRGFTTAYMEGQRDNSIMSYKRPNNRGQFIGRVKSVENGWAEVACEHELVVGDVIEFWTRRGHVAQAITDDCKLSSKNAHIKLDVKASGVRAADRVFRVRSAEAVFEDDEREPRVAVNGKANLNIGDPLEISFAIAEPGLIQQDMPVQRTISDRLKKQFEGCLPTAHAEGSIVEPARSKEITIEEVEAHINRLGNTQFQLLELETNLESGVGIGFSQLHNVRADALEKLRENILAPYKGRKLKSSKCQAAPVVLESSASRTCSICVLATNPECARAAKRAGAEKVYVPALNFKRGTSQMAGRAVYDAQQAGYPKDCVIAMPVVHHDSVGQSREARLDADLWKYITSGESVLIESLGALDRAVNMGALPEVGQHLPITNRQSLQAAAALGATRVWLSPELNLQQISDLAEKSPVPLGIYISGAQELMTTEHCVLQTIGPCSENCQECVRRENAYALLDRKGFSFPVFTDSLGRTHIYNSVSLDIVPALSDLVIAGVTSFMVDATLLTPEQTAQATGRAVHALKRALNGDQPEPKHPNTTSGHLHRGVM